MELGKYVDIHDYLSVVEKYAEGSIRLYRGQTCNEPLLPKIARTNPQIDTTEIEKKMFIELRRRGTLFIDRDMDDWDLMVYAQHFGMATRLLDWTSNPLTALWFACSDNNVKNSGFVYLLEVPENLLLDRQKQKDPFAISNTRVFKPNLNNSRIVAQSGWFTAHRYAQKSSSFVALNHNSVIKKRLIEIEIRGEDKTEALRILDVLGINNQSIFGDIEGVCKYINWLHHI